MDMILDLHFIFGQTTQMSNANVKNLYSSHLMEFKIE